MARRPLLAAGTLLAMAVFAAASSVWEPDRTVASLTTRWAPPPSRLDTVDGRLVHWRDEGPREDSLPLVLLHGTSSSLHTWDGWTDELRASRRVLRVDLPGFALTAPFADDDYGAANYLRFVRRWLDHVGVQRVVVAGNSFGGQLAWMLARAEPQRVAALVLVDAAGYPFTSTDVPIGFRLARLPVANLLLQRVTPRSVVRASVENVFGHPERVTDALVDRYLELTLREGNRRALVQRLRRHDGELDTLQVGQLTLPTLILWGGQDRLIPPMLGDRFAGAIPGSTLVRFDDLGHVPHEEDPARTLAPVREFLAKVAPRGVSAPADTPAPASPAAPPR